jgi:hypothetical protein
MTSTSSYSRHVAYTLHGGRVVTTRRSYGNSTFLATFQDQLEHIRLRLSATDSALSRRRASIGRATVLAPGRCARIAS